MKVLGITEEQIREVVFEAVRSADRACELCSCKSEDRLVEALVDELCERLGIRTEPDESEPQPRRANGCPTGVK